MDLLESKPPSRRGTASRHLAAWVVAVALSGCGGSPSAPPPPPTPPPTPPPATLADLSAAATSPEADARLACRDDVHVRVSLTNRAQSSVAVTGVHKASAVLRGSCREVPEFTYVPSTRIVPGNSTTVVMDRPLYSGGSGCCPDPDSCRGNCDIQETFEVVTDLGRVPAGRIQYNVTFQNCVECSSSTSAAASLSRCLRPPPRPERGSVP